MKTEKELKDELGNLRALFEFHNRGIVNLTQIQQKKVSNKVELLKEILEIEE